MKPSMVVALAGNPNSGKTSIFNSLTGAHQKVANYSGVTVEKREGHFTHQGQTITLVDLPGIYSLSAQSEDERVARAFILNQKPDVVVAVLDMTNLERNLYLAVQLMEMKVPLVLAMNMSDLAERQGIHYDFKKLERLFNAIIVPTVGSKGQGLDPLKDAVLTRRSCHLGCDAPIVRYHPDVEQAVEKIQLVLSHTPKLPLGMDPRWMSVQLLEQDQEMIEKINSPEVKNTATREIEKLEKLMNDSMDVLIAEARYGFISGACQEAKQSTPEIRHTFSDHVDDILIHRILGFPVFLLIMYLIFQMTFTLGAAPMHLIEHGVQGVSQFIQTLWPQGLQDWLRSLILDGVVGGVGGVLVFLPNIVLLFMGISILEDSGYMSRAAFIMDQLMQRIGLHGKSCIPMIIGFGCTVPAIMATRTMENRRDRLITMMILPLMSCGARLPIYALLAPAFFPGVWTARVVMLLYLTGMALAAGAAKLLSITVFKGESAPFVMELPPYRMPTWRSIGRHMWDKSGLYLKKAGTVILGISLLLWVLGTFPRLPQDTIPVAAVAGQSVTGQPVTQALSALEYSYMGRVGKWIEPAFRPLGFDWRISTAMIGAFAAKEVFVAQMGIVFSLSDVHKESMSLRDKLKKQYSPLVAFCMMLFMLIATPCMATVAITRKESGSWGWAVAQFGGLTLLAYVLTMIVFQVGRYLGIGMG